MLTAHRVYCCVMSLMSPRQNSIWLWPIAILVAVLIAAPARALTVEARTDVHQVTVGGKITITVTAIRSDALGDPEFAGAGVLAGASWKLGGQITQSPQHVGAEIRKEWQFELTAVLPDSARVTPVVYLGVEPVLGQRADSILGAPMLIVITPPPATPVWPWVAGGLAAAGVSVFVITRGLNRRREQSFEHAVASPLQEALEMLESARVNRRADRVPRYMADLERVLTGYAARRLGTSLTGRTSAEIIALLRARVSDVEILEELDALLQRCVQSRFGGGHPQFEILENMEQQARRTLERLDSTWV